MDIKSPGKPLECSVCTLFQVDTLSAVGDGPLELSRETFVDKNWQLVVEITVFFY